MMEARARADLYGFFSRLFVQELDDAAAALLCGALGRELLPQSVEAGEVARARDPDYRRAVLDADFAHVTIVNVVPYGSFYLRPDAMVEGGSQNPVSEFLRSHGFEVDLAAARSLAPDHIGIALETLSVLAGHEAEAEARPDSAYAARIRAVQRAFLREHLLPWAPLYLFAVERTAHTTLYREAAQVLMDFLGSDHEALSAEELV